VKRDIWVEFNDLDDRGRVTTYADVAEPGVPLFRGALVVAGDDEGNRARARVIGKRWRWRKPARITLEVDLTTFEAASPDTDELPSHGRTNR
jgi:hypothetical protein